MHLSAHITNIIKLLSVNSVVSLYAPLNLRKTIELPAEIHKNDAKCYVVVKSATIAIQLAEHQNNLQLATVGYATNDEENIDDDTNIAYVTADYMWKKMLTYKEAIDFTDVIMLDELYPGQFAYEMIISIWQKAFDLGVPRLIISHSLPINFKGLVVKEYLIKANDAQVRYVENNDILAIVNALPKTSGDVLIITADKTEKNKITNLIANSSPISIANLDYGINSKIGKRNVVIATNNETSGIRVQNINYIINTMTIKRKIMAPSGGYRIVYERTDARTMKQYEAFFGKNKNNTYYLTNKENKVLYEDIITNQDMFDAILNGADADFIPQTIKIFSKKSPIFKSEGFQYFFPAFQLAVRNSAFLWNWIKGLRFNDKIIEDAKKYNLNFENLETDITSDYSSIRPYHIPDTDRIMAAEGINPESIIDATANVGGDSINFLRMFPNVKLTALEIDKKVAMILRRNLNNASRIINSDQTEYDTKVINISANEYFTQDRYADLLYFDPEWGGVNYKQSDKIELKLDNIGIGIIIGNILQRGMTSLVVLKVPNNVNLEVILQDINLKINYTIHDVSNSYKLVIIRYDGKRIGNIAEEPEEVVLTYSTYPIFPGIVTSCLIDCAPYFNGKFTGQNDLESMLNMWNDFIKTVGSYTVDKEEISQWCRKSGINYNKMIELINLIKATIKSVMKLGFGEEIVERTFTTAGVLSAARPILAKVYQDQTVINKNEFLYFNPATKEVLRLDNKNITSDIHRNPPIGLIVLATNEIKTVKGTMKLITVGIDTDKNGLGRAIIKEKKEKRMDIDNPFDILDGLKVPRAGRAVQEGNPVIKKKIVGDSNMEDFYGKLKDAKKWSSKTVRTDKYDWLTKYLPNTDIYLDIGTGSGEDFAIIEKISKAKLGVASDVIDNRLAKDSEFLLITENVEIDLEDNSIDLITIFHAVHHSKDILFRLRDMVRILKPGGVLIIKDHDVTTSEDANNVSYEHFLYSIGEGAVTTTDAERYQEIEPMYYYPAYYIRNYLKNLGLEEVHFEGYSNPTKVYFAIFKK